MRKIDRNSNSGTAASRRSHAGAAQILRPRSPAPSISPRHLGQRLLEDIGLGGAAHPLRRAQAIYHGKGGPMMFPGGPKPKLPGFMMEPIRPNLRGPLTDAQANFLEDLDKTAPQWFAEKRLGHLRASAPVPRSLIGSSGYDDFLSHLARLQDPVANREFVNWMMTHHYKRPN